MPPNGRAVFRATVGRRSRERQEAGPMGRALVYLFRIAVLAILGLVGYALVADLPPPTQDVVVELPAPSGNAQ